MTFTFITIPRHVSRGLLDTRLLHAHPPQVSLSLLTSNEGSTAGSLTRPQPEARYATRDWIFVARHLVLVNLNRTFAMYPVPPWSNDITNQKRAEISVHVSSGMKEDEVSDGGGDKHNDADADDNDRKWYDD